MTRDTVTDDQILGCIADSWNTRGFPPSIREIGECVGLTSPSSVHSRLRRLVKDGLITMAPKRAGTIRIVKEGK